MKSLDMALPNCLDQMLHQIAAPRCHTILDFPQRQWRRLLPKSQTDKTAHVT
jgi:hypothetical protein